MFNFLKRKKNKNKEVKLLNPSIVDYEEKKDLLSDNVDKIEIPLPICIPYSCPSCEKSSIKIDSISHKIDNREHISVLSMSCIYGCDHKFYSWFRSDFNEPAVESELRMQIDELKSLVSDLNNKVSSLEKENMSLFSENREITSEACKYKAVSDTLSKIINNNKNIDFKSDPNSTHEDDKTHKSDTELDTVNKLKESGNQEEVCKPEKSDSSVCDDKKSDLEHGNKEDTSIEQDEIKKENNCDVEISSEKKNDVSCVVEVNDELQGIIDMPEMKLSDLIISNDEKNKTS